MICGVPDTEGGVTGRRGEPVEISWAGWLGDEPRSSEREDKHSPPGGVDAGSGRQGEYDKSVGSGEDVPGSGDDGAYADDDGPSPPSELPSGMSILDVGEDLSLGVELRVKLSGGMVVDEAKNVQGC